MKKSLLSNDLKLLTESEINIISGGEPTEDTGFWYDVFYVIAFTTVLNPRPTSWATMVRKY